MKTIQTLLLFFFLLALFPINQAGAKEQKELELQSESAVLMDAKSGQILYGKNENKRMNPASITKIATAIYALEHANLHDKVIVSENATKVEGTKVYLEAGEVVTMEKLIIGMLLNSGNDAAVAIAEHIDGSVGNFARHINNYLVENIGVTETHFENPNGLFGKNHYTTAADMAKITKYAEQNNDFRKIFGMKEYNWNGQSWNTKLLTHHRLLKGEYPYETATITGGKNGFIQEAGFTLVTAAEKNNQHFIVVTMKSNEKKAPYADTIELLDYGFSHFATEYIPKGLVFMKNGTKYIADENIYYTVEKGKRYSKTVNEQGILTIDSGDRKDLVPHFQLRVQSTSPKQAPLENTEQGNFSKMISMEAVANLGILAFFTMGIVLILRYRTKLYPWNE
ncbi:D-alanyl-D-alanine carboxypeptidase family protein [Bacillus andreraoultii]|uniref:D-alanyl-D-alanine carboxypeptidase family protein n=1 Tax=Bacillus andreraoultii TaxID=1499685 RepID=UPI00053AAC3B|nr:D-alanyl-D-alanine carboxypeptidase family protein [Bacillus andreraoultii]